LIEHKIAELLSTRFLEEDLKDCFLVEVKESLSGNKIEVFVDSDSQIGFDKCRIISRYLEQAIEEKRWLPEKYILEVSSPGLGNPLRLHRQYVNNVGRSLVVKTIQGDKIKGILHTVRSNEIIIVEPASGKGKKRKDEKRHTIAIENIKEAKIKVSF